MRVQFGIKVFVYFNLHKKCYSIKALEGDHKGLVIGHAAAVYLNEVTPKVSEAGRQRVLRERKKNVHAGLVGRLHAVTADCTLEGLAAINGGQYINDFQAVTYNPYKFDSFVMKNDTSWRFEGATVAFLTRTGIMAFDVTATDTKLQQQLELAL